MRKQILLMLGLIFGIVITMLFFGVVTIASAAGMPKQQTQNNGPILSPDKFVCTQDCKTVEVTYCRQQTQNGCEYVLIEE